MKRDIAAAQDYLVEHEHICSLDNPPVIREYLTASEEDRGIFEVLLKTYKTNTVLKAKQAWYEWKREFLEMVRPDVEAILGDMQEVSLGSAGRLAIGMRCCGIKLMRRTQNVSTRWTNRPKNCFPSSKPDWKAWRQSCRKNVLRLARLQSVITMNCQTLKLPLPSKRECFVPLGVSQHLVNTVTDV